MSMYNMVFGESKSADLLLAALGLNRDSFYRFRDCYLEAGEGQAPMIAVYTRGGGGNRRCFDDCKHEDCVRVKHRENRQHPLYSHDQDDGFDSTYATFYFKIPETISQEDLAKIEPEMNRADRWAAFLDVLKKAKK